MIRRSAVGARKGSRIELSWVNAASRLEKKP